MSRGWTDWRVPDSAFWIGEVFVDPSQNRLERGGTRLDLEPRVMEVLAYLAARPGTVVSREELLRVVWNGTHVSDDALNRIVSAIRKAFDDRADRARVIETIRKRGYRLVAPVRPAQRNRRAQAALGVGALVAISSALVLVLSARLVPSDVRPSVPVPLTSYPGEERDPSFTRDGHRLAFVWDGGDGGPFDVYVKSMGEETPRRMTATDEAEVGPVWSPEGARLAFTRIGGNGSELCMLSYPDGRESCPLRLRSSSTNDLDWSPDGKLIAFRDRPSPEAPHQIFYYSLDTRERLPATTPPSSLAGDGEPAFSPDGKWLAFARTSLESVEDVYRVSISGGDAQRLTFDESRITGLTWTPDSAALIMSSARTGRLELTRFPLDGGRPERIPGSLGAFDPSFSSKHGLAYAQWSFDANIWKLPLDNPSLERSEKIAASTRWDGSPDVSPDGKRVILVSNRSGAPSLWMSRVDGSDPQHIPFEEGRPESPRFSRDGRHLAFAARTDAGSHIFVMDVASGRARRVTSGTSERVAPSWSRNGRQLYFGSNRGGEWHVWRAELSGGAVEAVTRSGGFAGRESHDGRSFFFTKRNLPGLWRTSLPPGGREELVLEGIRPEDWANWTVTDSGIYFVESSPSVPRRLSFYRFETGQIESSLPAPRIPYASGLAVTPNGESLLFVQVDRSESDLMKLAVH